MTWPMRPSPMNPTFMALLLLVEHDLFGKPHPTRRIKSGGQAFPDHALDELAAHPLKFPANIVDDVAGLEAIGQHVPSIGLDLEMAREWFLLVKAQRVLDGEAGGAELAEIVEENRNVDVGAPF